MKITPGSPHSNAAFWMRSHSARAETIRIATQGSGVVEPDHILSHTIAPAGAVRPASGKTNGHDSSFSTACMKASVASTERLKCRNAPGLRFASIKSSISGWSQRSVAIIAPRRVPVDSSVAHACSHTCMKDTGPEATLPESAADNPAGRNVEKSQPMPPPSCIVTIASPSAEKIAPMESWMSPVTKQLNNVVRRCAPAPAKMRPSGKKRKCESAASKSWRHSSRWCDSGLDSAKATRDHVSWMDGSCEMPSSKSRYLAFQTCSAIGSVKMSFGISRSPTACHWYSLKADQERNLIQRREARHCRPMLFK